MEETTMDGDTEVMAMFPLGSVLLPGMPAVLRLFEQRYLEMLAELIQVEPVQFGIVLIAGGTEVGGGDRRFEAGCVARVVQLMEGEGFIGLVAEGKTRFEIVEWLDDAPYPRARVRFMPELEWNDDLRGRLDETERVVRRALAQSSEFEEQRWAADTELSEDPVAAAWQLAGIAPLGELDRYSLLRARGVGDLLDATGRLSTEAVETLSLKYADDEELGFGGGDDPRDD